MGEDGSTGARSGVVADVTAPAGHRVSAAGLGRWLVAAAPPRARGGVSIALVSDAAMRRLNRQYRGHDRATDVLSFPPTSGVTPEVDLGCDTRGRRFLGDIAIAIGVARRQARAHGHSLRTELRTLALHGLLHLLGYDHDTDRGRMRRLEERLRSRAGLPPGLIARARLPRGRR
jgi:probable rRNA maturation factor